MTTRNIRICLLHLFSWWKQPTGSNRPDVSPEFAYDSGLQKLTRDEWFWWVEQNPGWTQVVVLAVVAGESDGAIMFEGVDPVTGLLHRICWVVEFEGGTVAGVLETVAIVGRPTPSIPALGAAG